MTPWGVVINEFFLMQYCAKIFYVYWNPFKGTFGQYSSLSNILFLGSAALYIGAFDESLLAPGKIFSE